MAEELWQLIKKLDDGEEEVEKEGSLGIIEEAYWRVRQTFNNGDQEKKRRRLRSQVRGMTDENKILEIHQELWELQNELPYDMRKKGE